MNYTHLKGDCAPKFTPIARHPWRKAVYPWAAITGKYRIDEQRITRRRQRQRQKANERH